MIFQEKSIRPYDTIEYQQLIASALSAIGTQVTDYNAAEFESVSHLYQVVSDYAAQHQLVNTAIALDVVRGLMIPSVTTPTQFYRKPASHIEHYRHCLEVARFLIDLDVPVTRQETDILMAAAICHILVEHVDFRSGGTELMELYHMDPDVYEIVTLVTHGDVLSEKEQRDFYQRVRGRKLAIILCLADRSNLVQTLHDNPMWTAQEVIHETRTYFFPLCIYARENYPPLSPVVRVLTEKMRYMIEVTDILSRRFHNLEAELMKEILELQDDNFRLRSRIYRIGGIPDECR